MAVAMLALWMPATSLCLIERTGWLAKDNCCAESGNTVPTSTPTESSSCCTLAFANYKLDDLKSAPVTVPAAALLALIHNFTLTEILDGPQPEALAAPPPDFPVTWQFSSRTALSPRAPSFAS